jgi:hypothetical protein
MDGLPSLLDPSVRDSSDGPGWRPADTTIAHVQNLLLTGAHVTAQQLARYWCCLHDMYVPLGIMPLDYVRVVVGPVTAHWIEHICVARFNLARCDDIVCGP